MNTDAIGPAGAGQVRIDGTYGLAPHKGPDDAEAKAEALQGHYAGRSPTGGAEVISSQERLIAAASDAGEVNVEAVKEARAMLAAGQLDTPEAARRAAEAILKTGL